MSHRHLLPALLLALPTVAAAQAVDADVRCVLAGNFYGAAEKDPARKQLALATALFFAGRVDARVPPAQLKPVLAAQGKALTANTAPQVMTACARQFQAKERALQAVGREVAQAQPAAQVPRPGAPARPAPVARPAPKG